MKVKLITVAAIILAGVIVAVTTISSSVSKNNEYNEYLTTARANAENQVPYTACNFYNKAFAIKCEDEAVYEEYLEQAKILGENFYKNAVKEYVVKFPTSLKAYEKLCQYYYSQNSYKEVINTTLSAKENDAANEKVREYYMKCFYMVNHVMVGLEEATPFLGEYALIKREGLYGFADREGNYLLTPTYQAASHFFGSSASVYDGEEWFMINVGGYKVARPKEEVDYLSSLNNGLLVIGKDGKFGYTNSKLLLPEKLEYDYASNFKDNVAAVQKDDKWALLGNDGKFITDFKYDDIILDEFETCINNGVIFVKENGKYYMIDEEASKISKQGFDDAYPFFSDQPAAVCVDGKWGFVDANGEFVIKPEYAEAKSFSIGLAPVSINGVWGYISLSNEMRIEPQYTDAKPFGSNGIAPIKENNVWNYIKLLGYDN